MRNICQEIEGARLWGPSGSQDTSLNSSPANPAMRLGSGRKIGVFRLPSLLVRICTNTITEVVAQDTLLGSRAARIVILPLWGHS